jgi:hypothetical protein
MEGGSLWPMDRRRPLLAGSYKEGAEVLWEGPGRLVCKQEGCGVGVGMSVSIAAMEEPAAEQEKPKGLPDEDFEALLAAQEASALEWGLEAEDRQAVCCCRGDQRACMSCTVDGIHHIAHCSNLQYVEHPPHIHASPTLQCRQDVRACTPSLCIRRFHQSVSFLAAPGRPRARRHTFRVGEPALVRT